MFTTFREFYDSGVARPLYYGRHTVSSGFGNVLYFHYEYLFMDKTGQNDVVHIVKVVIKPFRDKMPLLIKNSLDYNKLLRQIKATKENSNLTYREEVYKDIEYFTHKSILYTKGNNLLKELIKLNEAA